MEPVDIDVQHVRPQVDELVRRFGPPNCQILVVDSVQGWARSVGLIEEDPFRAGMAVTRREDRVSTVVLLRRITGDIQRSVTGALLYRGFEKEVRRLQDPAAFLEHLVLHEIAHLILPGASETECDEWAFERLVSEPSLPRSGAA